MLRSDKIDTTGWSISGKDAGAIKSQLQELLVQSNLQVADLIKLFDDDNDMELQIDDMEFHKAMRTHFKYQGPAAVLDEVFKSLDADGSGEIGFDELVSAAMLNSLHCHSASMQPYRTPTS